MAALGEMDSQTNPRDVDAFEQWRNETEPVPIRPKAPAPATSRPTWETEPLAVHVLTHTGKWIAGKATNFSTLPVGVIHLQVESPIQRGTSGGPIVDDAGQLVGVVSWFGPVDGGAFPVVCATLPRWLLARIGVEGEN